MDVKERKAILRTIRYIVLLIFLTENICSQNLLLNSKFEDVNTCTEHSAPCAPEGWRLTTNYAPKYIGVNNKAIKIIINNTSSTETRSYAQTRLVDTLIRGKKYILTLKYMPKITNEVDLGFTLSNEIIIQSKSEILDMPFKNLVSKKSRKNRWHSVTCEFTATNESIYLIVGSFKKWESKHQDSFQNIEIALDDIELLPFQEYNLNQEDLRNIKEIVYSQNERHPISKNIIFVEDSLVLNREKIGEIEIHSTDVGITSDTAIEVIEVDSFNFNTKRFVLENEFLFDIDSFNLDKESLLNLDVESK